MSVQKRSRIFEVIIAILMIRPTLSILSDLYSYDSGDIISGLFRQNAPIFFITVSAAILIITRKYDRLWAKLLLGVSIAVFAFSERNRTYFDIKFVGKYIKSCIDYFTFDGIFTLFTFYLTIAMGIIILLMMFGVIKWKNRTKLLIYLYVIAGIAAVGALAFSSRSFTVMLYLLLTCFIYELQEKPERTALIGWAGAITGAASELFFEYYNKYSMKVNSTDDILDYLNAGRQNETIRCLIFAAAIILIPLIVFERKSPLEKVVSPVITDIEDEDDDESDDNE
ncbi:hypothetical protein [Ruminococcus flavefaciens]|uniref:hypothetical protein n=1 Tax=Ruminococcus flavefaciens TaxID=1265 RepID=UPI00048C0721|nr:hypothetical protein [Ruminococcus flavefaciens]